MLLLFLYVSSSVIHHGSMLKVVTCIHILSFIAYFRQINQDYRQDKKFEGYLTMPDCPEDIGIEPLDNLS